MLNLFIWKSSIVLGLIFSASRAQNIDYLNTGRTPAPYPKQVLRPTQTQVQTPVQTQAQPATDVFISSQNQLGHPPLVERFDNSLMPRGNYNATVQMPMSGGLTASNVADTSADLVLIGDAHMIEPSYSNIYRFMLDNVRPGDIVLMESVKEGKSFEQLTSSAQSWRGAVYPWLGELPQGVSVRGWDAGFNSTEMYMPFVDLFKAVRIDLRNQYMKKAIANAVAEAQTRHARVFVVAGKGHFLNDASMPEFISNYRYSMRLFNNGPCQPGPNWDGPGTPSRDFIYSGMKNVTKRWPSRPPLSCGQILRNLMSGN